MEPSLHEVTESELPALKEWLHKFLPDSFKLHYTVSSTLQGKWTLTTFVTLGWPDILAAGEGPVSPSGPTYSYHGEPRHTSVFSPDPQHLQKLLLWPGYLDWTQPMLFQAVSDKMTRTITEVGKTKGGDFLVYRNVIHEASETELPPRPVPEDYTMSALDPDLHTDYVASTWPYSRPTTGTYIRELLRRFPSLGLFGKDGECIGVEIGYEFGAIGMLHVRESHRGRGLGKIITSQLAQKYFCDGLPVIALACATHETARHLHTSIGFKEIGIAEWVFYYQGEVEEFKRKIGLPNNSYTQ